MESISRSNSRRWAFQKKNASVGSRDGRETRSPVLFIPAHRVQHEQEQRPLRPLWTKRYIMSSAKEQICEEIQIVWQFPISCCLRLKDSHRLHQLIGFYTLSITDPILLPEIKPLKTSPIFIMYLDITYI